MKLLVATETGHSPTTDPDNPGPLAGELLFPAEQCDKAHCMCRREFVSATTYERTMHARVVELDITEDQIRDIARDYVVATSGDEDPDEIDAYVRDLIEPAEQWPVGTVLERWGYELRDQADNTMPTDDADQTGRPTLHHRVEAARRTTGRRRHTLRPLRPATRQDRATPHTMAPIRRPHPATRIRRALTRPDQLQGCACRMQHETVQPCEARPPAHDRRHTTTIPRTERTPVATRRHRQTARRAAAALTRMVTCPGRGPRGIRLRPAPREFVCTRRFPVT